MLQKCQLENCFGKNLITDALNGEIFCADCGIVLKEKILSNTDTHTYNLEDFMSQSQFGPKQSLTIYDKGLSTMIGQDKDSTGRPLSSSTKYQFHRLRMWDSRSKMRKSSDKTLVKSLIFLNGLKEKLGISDNTVEVTCSLYRKAQNQNMTKGRTANSLMAAALYISCRQTMTPRSLDEIAKMGDITKKSLQKSVRYLIDKFELILPQYNTSSFLTKLSNDMEFSEKIKRYALNILADVEKSGLSAGKNPLGQSAASLYLAAILMGEDVNHANFCKKAGISNVTLRNRTKTIRKLLDL